MFLFLEKEVSNTRRARRNGGGGRTCTNMVEVIDPIDQVVNGLFDTVKVLVPFVDDPDLAPEDIAVVLIVALIVIVGVVF